MVSLLRIGNFLWPHLCSTHNTWSANKYRAAEATGDKLVRIFRLAGLTAAGVVLTSVAAIGGLMLYAAAIQPPPVDWQSAVQHAIDAGACDDAGLLAQDAVYAGVAEGADVFARIVSQAGDSPCPIRWSPALQDRWPTQEAYADHLAAGADALRLDADLFRGAQFGPGRLMGFYYALRGYRVRAFSNEFSLTAEYEDVPIGQRAAYAIWQLTCGYALGRHDRLRGPALEVSVRGYFNLDVDAGPWVVFKRRCARRALALVQDIGLDAPAPQNELADDLLTAARALPEGQYLWASRALAEGKFGPYAPQSIEDRVGFMRDVFRTLGLLVRDGHGPALALYGRHLLDGSPPEYDAIKMAMLAADPPLSDIQYAYGMLTLARAAGEDVGDDLAGAAETLSEAERGAALAWAEGLVRKP